MLAKSLIVAALSVGFVYAALGGGDSQCTPVCEKTSQKQAFDKGELVAHIKISSVSGGLTGGGSKVNTPLGSAQTNMNGQGAQASLGTRRAASSVSGPMGGMAQTSLPKQEPYTYTASIVEKFKPKQLGQQGTDNNVKFTSPSEAGCSFARLIENQEYLVVAKRNGSGWVLNKCDQFPLIDNGIPTGPLSWTIVSNQIGMMGQKSLLDNLKEGFKSSGSQGQKPAGAFAGGRTRPSRPHGVTGAPQAVSQSDQSQQGGDDQQMSQDQQSMMGGQQQQGDDQQQQGGDQQQGGSDQQQGGSDQQQQGGDQQQQGGEQQQQGGEETADKQKEAMEKQQEAMMQLQKQQQQGDQDQQQQTQTPPQARRRSDHGCNGHHCW